MSVLCLATWNWWIRRASGPPSSGSRPRRTGPSTGPEPEAVVFRRRRSSAAEDPDTPTAARIPKLRIPHTADIGAGYEPNTGRLKHLNLNLAKPSLTQGVTPSWKCVHRISGYQRYQPDIRGIINGYQQKIDQISVKYLTDFSMILKNICWIYLKISQISVDIDHRVRNLKNRWKRSCFDRLQQPDIEDINRISRRFVHLISSSCHPLALPVLL